MISIQIQCFRFVLEKHSPRSQPRSSRAFFFQHCETCRYCKAFLFAKQIPWSLYHWRFSWYSVMSTGSFPPRFSCIPFQPRCSMVSAWEMLQFSTSSRGRCALESWFTCFPLFSIANVPCTEAMCSQLSKLFIEPPRILKCCWQLWVHHPGYCNQKSLIKWTGLKRGMSRLQKTWAERKLGRRPWNEDEQCEARKRETLRKKWTVEYPLPLAKSRGILLQMN